MQGIHLAHENKVHGNLHSHCCSIQQAADKALSLLINIQYKHCLQLQGYKEPHCTCISTTTIIMQNTSSGKARNWI